MKRKTIKVRFQQTVGGAYRINQITNAVQISAAFGRPVTYTVGDLVPVKDVTSICDDQNYEVVVNATLG